MSKIFVFGSNLAGIHGAGAALHASKYFGAEYGHGIGRTGNCYAIPTKDEKIRTLPLVRIQKYVNYFIDYARYNPTLEFFVTRIGCGLAGYTNEQIAPMFKFASRNCEFHPDWCKILGR